ncbi:hypothetical protein ACFY41_31185 [Streptomyces syringium]|uniref:hypothetical protein n=1 Tax=Streptomyces syringium TaxID=76729 RepID=UPI003675A5AF
MAWRDFWGFCRSATPFGRALGAVGWVIASALGGVWWWAVFRLLAQPERAGPVEGLVVAGGWGLSLLPVHCVPWARTARHKSRWAAWAEQLTRAVARTVTKAAPEDVTRTAAKGVTRAWPPRRWGAGSGRS